MESTMTDRVKGLTQSDLEQIAKRWVAEIEAAYALLSEGEVGFEEGEFEDWTSELPALSAKYLGEISGFYLPEMVGYELCLEVGEADVTLTWDECGEFATLLVIDEQLCAVRRVQISRLTARLRGLAY